MPGPVSAWSVEDVCSWGADVCLPDAVVADLAVNKVDGLALLELTRDEIKELVPISSTDTRNSDQQIL